MSRVKFSNPDLGATNTSTPGLFAVNQIPGRKESLRILRIIL